MMERKQMEPTNKQIDRQDLVDNAIFDLINDLNPSQEKIERIAYKFDILRRMEHHNDQRCKNGH